MTDPTDVPRLTKAQLRELAAARQRGAWPDCFICGSVVLNHQLAHGPEYAEQRIAVCVPCGHCFTYNVNVAAQAQAEVDSGAATEATDRLDLRTLIARAIHQYDNHHALSGNDIPSEHHYGEADAVLAALLGPVPAGVDTASWTAVRAIQLMNQAGAERDVAQARVPALEAEVAAARSFAESMRDFCSPHGVSVHYAEQLVAAMDRAKEGGA